MENEFDLIFSEDALLSRVLFLASKKEINIFVEDQNKEYEYEELFERLFGDEIKINCIFPTGGKTFLEEAFNLFGESKEYGTCFFIADGDFDVILQKHMIEADNFLYLKRYNIESYLLHKEAVLQFMRPKLKKTKRETEVIVNYDNWLNTVTPFFKKLFALHCLVQKFCPEIKNVARGIEQFIDKKGYPNDSAFEKYKNEIAALVSNIDLKIEQMTIDLENTYGPETSCYVCGKCYISSLKSMLNSKISKKINYDELKAILISGFDVSILCYVKEKLYKYISE